jgi:hypothetical protein
MALCFNGLTVGQNAECFASKAVETPLRGGEMRFGMREWAS